MKQESLPSGGVWNLLTTKTGTASITYPNKWNEIMAVCRAEVSENVDLAYTFVIPKNCLTARTTYFSSGYAIDNKSTYTQIIATTATMHLATFMYTNTDYKNSAITKYYYR